MPFQTPLRITLIAAALIAAGVAIGGGVRAPESAAADTCSLYVSTDGSDYARGSSSAPLRTVGELVDRLRAGQTGCLYAGVYTGNVTIRRRGTATAPITVRALTAKRATIRGQLRVSGDYVAVTDLNLDGTNSSRRPSPLVNGDHNSFLRNDVSNAAETCFVLGDKYWGVAAGTRIARNVIHDCGVHGTNRDHGIYVRQAVDTVIHDNVIRDNPDRGVQLYPNADRSTITGNVIDRNGEGLIFSGDAVDVSGDNLVEDNIISGSLLRWDVEAYWSDRVGAGNVVQRNCIAGGARGAIQSPQVGFTALDNNLDAIEYAESGGSEYRLADGSTCEATPPVLP
jgi:parallel beta-helix repeat protein